MGLIINSLYFHDYFFLIYFYLEDNCFNYVVLVVSVLQGQSAIRKHMSPPSEPPSHPLPQPTPLGCRRALSWLRVMHQLPAGYFTYRNV